MINDILTAIKARLADTEPNLKYLDEDWGQLDYYRDAAPVKFPCALLELQQVNWKNQSQKVQDGEVAITIRVADLALGSTNPKASGNRQLKAVAIWAIMQNIHTALHGWRPADYPEFSALIRVSTRKVKRDDGVREFEITYSTSATDESAGTVYYNVADADVASEKFDTVPPGLDLEVELKKA
jgi:hypothetical protein